MEFKEWINQELVLEKVKGVVDFYDALKYAAKYLNCRIVDTKKGLQVCPPLEYSPVCYSMHLSAGKQDKTPKHLVQFLASAYGVSPTVLTDAINRRIPLKLNALVPV